MSTPARVAVDTRLGTEYPDPVDRFFAYARERHGVYLRRAAGEAPPWTDDPVLLRYRFTCVFRELDRTTQWLRDHVREPMRAQPEVLLAVVCFRWFNRITSGEVIFNQTDLVLDGATAFDHYARTGDATAIQSSLQMTYPDGPWVTGSYMIRTPDGLDKLSGVCLLLKIFWLGDWRDVADTLLANHEVDSSLQMFTRWLQKFTCMGPFLAYEIACDLYYTDLLCRAPDAMTWANVGPGARRGLHRLADRRRAPTSPGAVRRPLNGPLPETQALEEMQGLLAKSQHEDYWPQLHKDQWPRWDMRTVEHTLCEYDKYERVRLGEGAPRQLFKGGGA